jgi:hypothetical protein
VLISLFNKTNKRTNFSKIIFVKKLYMFPAVPLPIIKSSPLYIRHWYMSCRFDDSFQARPLDGLDGHRNCPKHVEFLDKNKFGKIIASVGFTKKKFVTMHGHMKIKFMSATLMTNRSRRPGR